MKKIFTVALLGLSAAVFSADLLSQNIQFHYDFGKTLYRKDNSASSRPAVTTTVEMFRPDKWGNTFFFVDMNYGSKAGDGGVLGAYWEISRELSFWKAPFLIHLEYNGGLDIQGLGSGTGAYDNAWLAGPTWSVASSDFSKTFSLSAMYKFIPRNIKTPHNFQITAVWNIYFSGRRFLFCGFADFWKENRPWQQTRHSGSDGTDFIFMSEPQFWYNLNTIKGLEDFNFSIGTEIEVSNNFVSGGFYAIPTLAAKWTF